LVTSPDIEAVAFDCYGTLVDFGEASFADAYATICAEQSIPVDGRVFYDKWMEVWRRLAEGGSSADGGTIGVLSHVQHENEPGPLSETEVVPPHPAHHTPSAGRNGTLAGPVPPYRPYRDEWPEHFAICFEELSVQGAPYAAHDRLRQLIASADAFPESLRVVEAVRQRLPVALMSNADDDFLRPCLERNGLAFPIVVSSETAQAYKPHASIFESLCTALGLPPQRVLYVGDSRFADIVGAKHAGLQAAWLNRAGAARSLDTSDRDAQRHAILDRFPPDYEIPSLDAVLDILRLK
jgi:2-haloalkanoic acid dehalogenase type II